MVQHRLSRETRTLVCPQGMVSPQGLLTFIHFNCFTAEWKRLGLSDDDLRALETLIMISPTQFPVMSGTGGLRKCRFVPRRWNTGKSGALRIGYVYMEQYSVVGLIVVYAKNDKANIAPKERQVIKDLLDRFKLFVENGG